MNFRKWILLCVALLFAFPVFGCGALLSCIFDDSLVMRTEALPNGVVGQDYSAEVKAEITDVISGGALSIDADIDYEIEEGRLPTGLELVPQGNTVFIQGIPEEAGEFPITIEAFSLELYQMETNESCTEPSVTSTYNLIIEEAPAPDVSAES